MARMTFATVGDYIAAQPQKHQTALRRVRRVIKSAIPGVAEAISYQIPAYKVGGKTVLYFAGFREHYSLFQASDALMAAFRGRLDRHRVSKGTLRFSLAEPVPEALIARIAKFQAKHLGRTTNK